MLVALNKLCKQNSKSVAANYTFWSHDSSQEMGKWGPTTNGHIVMNGQLRVPSGPLRHCKNVFPAPCRKSTHLIILRDKKPFECRFIWQRAKRNQKVWTWWFYLISKHTDGTCWRHLVGRKPRGCQLSRDPKDENLGNGNYALTSEHESVLATPRGCQFYPAAQASSQRAQDHWESQTLQIRKKIWWLFLRKCVFSMQRLKTKPYVESWVCPREGKCQTPVQKWLHFKYYNQLFMLWNCECFMAPSFQTWRFLYLENETKTK